MQDEDPKLRAFRGGFCFRTFLRSFEGRVCFEMQHFVTKKYSVINITLTSSRMLLN